MSDSKPDRVKAVLHELLALPAQERAAHIERLCDGDEGLQAQVEASLESQGDTKQGMAKTQSVGNGELMQIGRYKLLQQIGEGGCGTVYMAEQEKPVRRRVAIKIIKLGMDTKQVIARFEAERQALALMDHPNIA